MQNKIQISIPKPCESNINTMSVSQNGYFCDFCQKEVVDFRNFSSEEIQNYFLNIGNKKVCGAFKTSQITLPYYKSTNWFLGTFSKISFFIFLMLQKLETEAQIQTKQTTIQTEIKNIEPKTLDSDTTFSEITISGVILAANDDKSIVVMKGDPIIGATVMFENTKIGTTADKNGRFILKIKLNNSLNLKISFAGFENKNILIDKYEKHQFVEIFMESDSCGGGTIGEVVPGYRNIFRRTYIRIFHPNRYKCIYY